MKLIIRFIFILFALCFILFLHNPMSCDKQTLYEFRLSDLSEKFSMTNDKVQNHLIPNCDVNCLAPCKIWIHFSLTHTYSDTADTLGWKIKFYSTFPMYMGIEERLSVSDCELSVLYKSRCNWSRKIEVFQFYIGTILYRVGRQTVVKIIWLRSRQEIRDTASSFKKREYALH